MHPPKKIAVIGSGMAGLTTACLLSRDGAQVTLFEQNWMPGGCSSSYWRKGYWFETGATTLVGLDPGMPLHQLLEAIDVQIEAQKLDQPMEVWLDGQRIQRHAELNRWIEEAEKHFGPNGQRPFWEKCHQISQQVWRISSQQHAFPPQSMGDLFDLIRHFKPQQIAALPAAFTTVADLLREHQLHLNERFVRFIDEQLMITAQNTHQEVNLLFGATALCYTNVGNYYVAGGLINLVNPLVEYLQQKGGEVHYRTGIRAIEITARGVRLYTTQSQQAFDAVVSSIPLNNLAEMLPEGPLKSRIHGHLLPSSQLSSALQLGIGFKPHRNFDCLHHQIHLPHGLEAIGSHSIFLSLHPASDQSRAPKGQIAASVSTHWHQPATALLPDRSQLEQLILNTLEQHDLILKENITYLHSSGPRSWEKWTGRKWGFVGGYPQFKNIKPWQMMGARLLKKKIYLCGDTTYPGQGIPGTVLSGLTAYRKMKIDGLI